MYEESLESLIQRCIADGVLTPSEIDVLRRRAEKCGEDPDEVVIYAEGLLAEKQEKAKRDDQLAAKAAEHAAAKVGKVRTCPACGNSISATVLVCPHCKHELRDTKSSDAVNDFFNKYAHADADSKVSLIEAFPVPNNKEDIAEFASMASPLAVSNHIMPTPLKATITFGLDLILLLGAWLICVLAKVEDMRGVGAILSFVALFLLIGTAVFLMDSSDDEDGTKKRAKALSKAWIAKLKQVKLKTNFFGKEDPAFNEQMSAITKEYNTKQRIPVIISSVIWGIVLCIGVALGIANTKGNTNAPATLSDEWSTMYINSGDFEYCTNNIMSDNGETLDVSLFKNGMTIGLSTAETLNNGEKGEIIIEADETDLKFDSVVSQYGELIFEISDNTKFEDALKAFATIGTKVIVKVGDNQYKFFVPKDFAESVESAHNWVKSNSIGAKL